MAMPLNQNIDQRRMPLPPPCLHEIPVYMRLPQRLERLQPVQAFDEHIAIFAGTDLYGRLLPFLQNGLGQSGYPCTVERFHTLHRHIYLVDRKAVFLADRVVMMTNGPEAEVGDILEIDFERPRNRKKIMETEKYYEYREHLIDYLHNKPHLKGDERPYVKRGVEAHNTLNKSEASAVAV